MKNQLKILELFSGSRSIGKEAEKRRHKVFSSDFQNFPNTDYVCDIMDFDINKIPFDKVDVLWASPHVKVLVSQVLEGIG